LYDTDPPEPFGFVSLFNNGAQRTREQFVRMLLAPVWKWGQTASLAVGRTADFDVGPDYCSVP
jgi:hypothetical protein